MQKKVIYCQATYRPGREGISNEIVQLSAYLKNQNIATDVLFRDTTDNKVSSFLNDLIRLKLHIHRGGYLRNTVCHVWATGKMLFFHLLLPDINKNIITLVNVEGVAGKIQHVKKYSHIIVETEMDKQVLHKAGVDLACINVIHPYSSYEIDEIGLTGNIFDKSLSRPLKILFASVPFDEWDLENRGVDLLINVAYRLNSKVQIILLCRTLEIYNIIQQRFAKELSKTNNILLKYGSCDMQQEFAEVDAVILPFRENRKSCPNSMVEAISLGKPVIVSKVISSSTIVEQTGCGVVVDPTIESIGRSVEQLRLSFKDKVNNCINASDEIFSKERFLHNYEQIYSKC